jgi:ABC-2 type transport system ATP-binding protein
MDEAERCSRVGLMYKGRLIVCDRPEQVKQLVRGELIALRPADIRRALPLIEALDGVIEVQTFGDQLRIFAGDRAVVEGQIRDRLDAAAIDVLDMRRTRPRMEEAFISLIQRQRAENREGER